MEESAMKALCARFEKLQPAVISDVLDVMGWPDQCLSSNMGLKAGTKVAGPAFCLRGTSTVGAGMPAPAGKSKPVYEMDRQLYDGCVAVIETGGHNQGAVVGGNLILSFKLRGCRGMIIDGGIRDGAEVVEMGFTTFCRFVTPRANKGLWEFTQIEIPVRLPGQTSATVVINPGDFVVGDYDGVVVVPREVAEEVAAAAEKTEALEHRIKDELLTGEDREKVYKRNDRYAHIAKKR